MPYELVNRENETCLRLEGRVGVSDVRALYEDLRREMNGNRRLVVDVADCERVDTSIVQLLFALKTKAPETKIVNWSAGFRESLGRVGPISELEQADGKEEN